MPSGKEPQPESKVAAPKVASGDSIKMSDMRGAPAIARAGNLIAGKKLRAHGVGDSTLFSAPLPNPFSSDGGDLAAREKLVEDLRKFGPGADRDALANAMKAFGDANRLEGLAAIYADLHAPPGASSTDAMTAGQAGGDQELELLLIKLVERGDFASQYAKREAVARWELWKFYGLTLERFERLVEDFTEAFGRAALQVGWDILERIEAVCVSYLATANKLLPAARDMANVLRARRSEQLAALQAADERLLDAALSLGNPQKSDAMRDMADAQRAKVHEQVQEALAEFAFAQWADFDSEEALRKAADPYAMLKMACFYLQERLSAVHEVRTLLKDPKDVWSLDLLLPETQKQFGIAQEKRSLYAQIIETQLQHAKSTRVERIASLLSWALIVLGMVVPGGSSVGVMVAGTGAAAAARTAWNSIESLQVEPLARVGLKSKDDPVTRLWDVLSIVGATMAMRGFGRKWLAWLQGRPRPVLPREPARGTLPSALPVVQLKDAHLQWQRVTEGDVLRAKVMALRAQTPEDMDHLAKQVLNVAMKENARRIELTAEAGKFGRPFKGAVRLDAGSGAAGSYTNADRVFNEWQLKQLLNSARSTSMNPHLAIKVNIDIPRNFAHPKPDDVESALDANAWPGPRGVMHIDVTHISAPDQLYMPGLARSLLQQFSTDTSVKSFKFTAHFGRRIEIEVTKYELHVEQALRQIAATRWPVLR